MDFHKSTEAIVKFNLILHCAIYLDDIMVRKSNSRIELKGGMVQKTQRLNPYQIPGNTSDFLWDFFLVQYEGE